MHAFHLGLCRFSSTIVDIGCGCGRLRTICGTIDLSLRLSLESTLVSTSTTKCWNGVVEISTRGGLNFIDPPRPAKSTEVAKVRAVTTCCQWSMTALISYFRHLSLTHLLENDLINYCREGYRVLKQGGSMAMYCFCINYLPPTYGSRHTFRHTIGNAHVESMSLPEAAVAYDEKFLFAAARGAGFRTVELVTGPDDLQPMLLCRK